MKTSKISTVCIRILFSTLFLLVSTGIHAQLKYLQDVKDLPPHPRILMLSGEEQQIKANIAADPTWSKIHRSIIDECDNIIALPAKERIVEGRRLLSVSREVLRRVFYLSYAYRMSGEEKYAERAEKEMLAVAAFSDWNPSHFLDVAEMTMAMAIGYDWLYNRLSPASRDAVKSAILQKGIDPSLKRGNNGFLRSTNNWNQVCNGGMSYGALAIYEDMPEFAKLIVDRAVESIRLPMGEYAPDGAYPEGYSYWEYGTGFNLMFLSAVTKIFGTDYGLSQLPGFLKTPGYHENMVGPTNLCYNYADCGSGAGGLSPFMFWYAAQTKNPSLLWLEKKHLEADRKYIGNRLLPAVMIWGSATKVDGIQPPAELMWAGRGANPVALMRSSWTDPNAVFVGFKGGTASSSHAHMDAGSFVMEADGVRWAMDFGSQGYHSLESKGVDLWNKAQNSQRWQVFRYNNFVHNTLTVNDQLHLVGGFADLSSWSSAPSFMNAVADLSKIFEGQLSQSLRGVALVDGQYVAVRDEITAADKEVTVRWTMLTPADVKIKGKNSVELKKNGKKLTLQVVEPATVTMKTWTTASTNDYDDPNPGTVLVGFEVKIPARTSAALTVKLIPQSAKKTGAKVPELKAWPK